MSTDASDALGTAWPSAAMAEGAILMGVGAATLGRADMAAGIPWWTGGSVEGKSEPGRGEARRGEEGGVDKRGGTRVADGARSGRGGEGSNISSALFP